jgi:uncharacterized protein (DUF885 family)
MRGLDPHPVDPDVPAHRIEAAIAPTNDGGIYYTGPSEDWSRPGRMWWSVPDGVETFSTWKEVTVVYHEGVPGHHLQISHAMAHRRRGHPASCPLACDYAAEAGIVAG